MTRIFHQFSFRIFRVFRCLTKNSTLPTTLNSQLLYTLNYSTLYTLNSKLNYSLTTDLITSTYFLVPTSRVRFSKINRLPFLPISAQRSGCCDSSKIPQISIYSAENSLILCSSLRLHTSNLPPFSDTMKLSNPCNTTFFASSVCTTQL